ncbi:hypothetical protein ACEWY4_009824 [Coilia grayii]|uniref:PARP catalytic domain-containing protein n=1 Tax=Coilia grayii TaxID=363190 RepID=A0ABD1K7H8_9TELE
MSFVTFYGWEVEFEGDHHLRAEQEARSGRLYTMYHGTTVKSAQDIIQNGFRQSPDGMLGAGVYVSRDQKKAERYPLKSPVSDRVVLKLQVDCGKVKRIDTDNHPMQKTWHMQGYDTAWVPPNCGMKSVPSGLEEDCIWDPQRVEVTDIAVAPNTTLLAQLRQLISQRKSQSTSTRPSEARSGRLYTMYHGTTVKSAQDIIQNGFRQSPDGLLGAGVYVSRDQKKAERYPLKSPVSDRVVLKLQVDCGKVKRIDTDNHPMQKTWNMQGYDTAWVPPNCGMKSVSSGLEEDCIWDPQRVEVTDIAVAPNTTLLAQLRQLISQRKSQSTSTRPSGQGACNTCKTPNHAGHVVQPCWGCGENICTFMAKHICSVRP